MQAVLKRIDNLPDLVLRVGSFFLTFVFTHKKTQRVIGGLEIENPPFSGFWSEHFSLYRILLSALPENCKKFWQHFLYLMSQESNHQSLYRAGGDGQICVSYVFAPTRLASLLRIFASSRVLPFH